MACRQWQRRRRRRAERRAGRRSLSAADRQPAACMLPLLVLRPPSCCCTRTHAWSAVSMITCTAGPQWAASGHGRPVALAPASLLPCLLLLLLLDVRTEDQRSRGTEERSWERQKAVPKKSVRLPAWRGGGGGHVCRGPPLPPRRRALKPHSPHPVQLTALVKCACVSRRPKGLYRRLEGRQKEAVELRAPLGVAKQLCKTSQSTFLRANS